MDIRKKSRWVSAFMALIMLVGVWSASGPIVSEAQASEGGQKVAAVLQGEISVPAMAPRAYYPGGSSGTFTVKISPPEAAEIIGNSTLSYTYSGGKPVPKPVINFKNVGNYVYWDYESNDGNTVHAVHILIGLNNSTPGTSTGGTVTLDTITGAYPYVVTLLFIERNMSNPPTFTGINKTYDGQNAVITVSGKKTDDKIEYKRAGATDWTTTAPVFNNVVDETVQIRVTNPGAYYPHETSVQVKISPRPITAKANDLTLMAGQAIPPASSMDITVSGAVSGQESQVLGLIRNGSGFSITTTANASSPAGQYPIVLKGPTTIQNYSVTYVGGILTLQSTSRPSTPVVNYVEREYDGNTYTMSVTGTISGDKVEYSVAGGAWTTTAPSYKNAKTESVKVRVTNSKYTTFEETGTNLITPKAITARVNNLTLNVGQTLPAANTMALTLVGVVSGEESDVLSAIRGGSGFAITTTASAGSPAGQYPMTLTGPASIPNYSVYYFGGTLTLESTTRPSDPVVKYVAREYDGNTYTMSVAGTVSGDKVEYSVAGGAWTTTAPSYKDAKTENVAVRVTNPRFETFQTAGVNAITPKGITAIVDDVYLSVGEALPSAYLIPLHIEGGVQGEADDIIARIRSGSEFSITSPEGTKPGAGEGAYDLILRGPSDIKNYTVVYRDGMLVRYYTQRPSVPTIEGINEIYDGNTYTMVVGNTIAGDVVEYKVPGKDWSTIAPSYKDVKTEEVEVRVSNPAYKEYTKTVTNQITRRALSVTVEGASREYGQPNPNPGTLGLRISGHVSSEAAIVEQAIRNGAGFAITIDATPTTNVGNASITVTGPSEIPNYTVIYQPGVLKITPGTRSIENGNVPDIIPVRREYNGQVSVIEVKKTLDGDTVQFDDGTGWKNVSPEYLNAMDAEQRVQVRVSNPNYLPYAEGVYNRITKRAITARVQDASRLPGEENPAAGSLAITLSNVVTGEEGDVERAIRTGAGFGVTSPAGVNSPAGVYDLILTGPAQLPNYTVTYQMGKLTIISNTRPSNLVPEIIPVFKVYDGVEQAVRVITKDAQDTVEYFYNNGWQKTPPVYKDAMDVADKVDIRVTNPKYEVYNGSATSQITRAQLTVTADNKTRAYGAPDPVGTVTLSEGVAAELPALSEEIKSAPGFAVRVTENPSAMVGSVLPITVSGPNPWGNYNVTYVNGTLTIIKGQRPAGQEPAATGVNTTYDGQQHYIALQNITPQDYVEYLVDGNWTTISPAFYDHTPTPVGVKIRITNPNYPTVELDTTNEVRRAVMTVRADDKTVAYGQAFPTETFTVDGPVPADYGDMRSALLAHRDFVLKTDAVVNPNAGARVPIKISGPSALGNYSLAYTDGTLLVVPAQRTGDLLPDITGVDTTYDAQDHKIQVENTIPGDKVEYLRPNGTWTTDEPIYHDAAAAETVSVRVVNDNYLPYEVGTVNQVRRAKLVVTADNKSREYGEANPALTISLHGPVPSEYAILEALLRANSAFSLTAAENPGAAVGTEIPIYLSGPALLPNYTVEYVNGTLSVGKAERPADNLPRATAVNQPYDGQTHVILIENLHPDDAVEYSNGAGGWTKNPPVYLNAMDAPEKVTVRFVNPNFAPYQVDTVNQIHRAQVEAKADDKTSRYGAPKPTFTFTVSGAVSGEEAYLATLIRAGQHYLDANVNENTPIGDVVIEFRGEQKVGNYAVIYKNGILTITKGVRPGSLVPDIIGVTQEYDGDDHAVKVNKKDKDETVEYYYDGEWKTEPPTYKNAMDVPESVPVRVTSPRYDDYLGEAVSQITRARLVVSADNKTKLFGAPRPALTITVSGKLAAELDALKREILAHNDFAIDADVDERTPVGDMPITVTGPQRLMNYTVEYVDGILSTGKTERPGDSLPIVMPVDRVYDGKSYTITVDNLLLGDKVEYSDSNGFWRTESPVYKNAMDSYEDIWVRVTNDSYPPYQVKTSNQIRRADVTASVHDVTRGYGQPNPAFSYDLDGVVAGEDLDVRNAIRGYAHYYLGTDAGEKTPVGRYAIDMRGPAYLRNYRVRYEGGWLTIEKGSRPANLAPEINGVNREYDGDGHPLQVITKDPEDEVEYYYDGEWKTEPPVYTDAMDTPEEVPVRVTNPNFDDYDSSGVSQITRARLTVSAVNMSRGYGEPNPAFDITVNGPVSRELADLKTEIQGNGSYSIGSTADALTPSGTFAAIVVKGPAQLKNYTVTYHDGLLAIGISERPADAIPTVKGFDTIYDGTAHYITVDGLIAGDRVMYSDSHGGWTTEAQGYRNAMDRAEKVLVRVENDNYLPFQQEVDVFVRRRPIVATAVDATRKYGEANPVFAIRLQNVAQGEEARVEDLIRERKAVFYLDTSATRTTLPGVAPIILSGPNQITNYTVTYAGGTLTIEGGGQRPDNLKPDINAPDGEYDGKEYPLDVVTYDPDDEVEYYYDGEWKTDPPVYKDAMDKPEDVPVRVTNPKYEDYEEDAKPYIRRAALKVSADNKSRAYGAADPAFTLTLNGPVPSEYAMLEAAIRGGVGFRLEAPDSKPTTAAGSEVDILVAGLVQLPNYNVTYASGKLSVGKAERPTGNGQEPTAKEVNTPYDGIEHWIVVENLIPGDRVTFHVGNDWVNDSPAYRDAMNSPDIVIVRIENDNYQPFEIRTSNQVTHAAVTAIADDKTRGYGEANPEATFRIEGAVVVGEMEAVKNEIQASKDRYSLTILANATTPVGEAVISLSGPAKLKNYTVTYRDGTLTIGKVARPEGDIHVDGLDDVTYDGKDHEVTIDGTRPGDEISWSDDGGKTWNEGEPPAYREANEDDENKEIIIKVENPNYDDFISDPVPVEVKRAKLTAAADSKQRQYGVANPELTYTLSGPIPGEYAQLRDELAKGGLRISTNATEQTPPGPDADITITGPEKLKNYVVIYVDGKLSIGKAARPSGYEVVVRPVDRVYDGGTYKIGVENTIPGEDTVEYKVGNGAWTTIPPQYREAIAPESVVVRVTNNKYDTFQTTVVNEIRRAALNVRVENASRRFGEENPEFMLVFNGAVNGEATAVEGEIRNSGRLTLRCAARKDTSAGSAVPIELSGPDRITNYTVTYTNGTLTIGKGIRPDDTTVNGIDDTEYDGNEHEVTIDGKKPGDNISWSDDGGKTWNEGEPPPYVDATGKDDPKDIIVKIENDDYETVITDPVPVEIRKAKLTVKADDQQRRYKAPNPQLTVTLQGAVKNEAPQLEKEIRAHGDFKLTTTANEATAAGTKTPITVAGPRELKNYEVTYVAGELSVENAPRPGDVTITGPGGVEYDGEEHGVDIDGTLPDDKISWSDDGGKTWNEGEPPPYTDATKDGEPKDIIVKVENPNYDDYISGPVNVEVRRRPLTVIAGDSERMYGDPNGAFTYTINNIVIKEIAQVRNALERAASFGIRSTATATTSAGTKAPIMATGPETLLDNYSVTYANGTLTITKRPLRAIVEGITINQGEAFKDKLKITFAPDENGKGGIVNGDEKRITVQYTLAAQEPVPVGVHKLSARLSNTDDYDVTVVPATLTVRGQVNYTSNYPANYPANGPWANATYVDKSTYVANSQIVLPSIETMGFDTRGLTFIGWEYNGRTYKAGESVPMGTEAMVFKAMWTVNQYTLTVQHRAKDTGAVVAPDQTAQLAFGQAYIAKSVQHATYKAEKDSESGVMQDSDKTIVFYYASTSGGNNGGNTGGSTGGSTGDSGNTGGSTGGSTGGGTGSGTGGSAGGGNVGSNDGAQTGQENPAADNAGAPSGNGPQYMIMDNDVPLGGITSRNVGHCSD